jgi:hypothetical protein
MFMGPGDWETLSKPSGMWEILLEAQSTLEMGGAALRIWRRIKLLKALVLTLVVSPILGNLSMFCIISFIQSLVWKM